MGAPPAPNDKASGPRSRKGAETRARLVGAAKEIFEENGFLDARISDIAERAGLSHGSFYHYFESKEEIFREVAYAVGDQLSAPLGEVVLDPESEASPQDRIRQAIRMHLESYRKEARIMGVIEQVSRYDAEMRRARFEQQRLYGEQVEDSIRRMQRNGMIDRDLDPVIAAAALGSMTTRFPELWLVEGALECSFDDAAEQLARVFINGLGFKGEAVPRKKGRAALGA
ncbi:MAG TPA: TetR/AcrR family transcriptional regulator [Acidimicrobiales bacterium]|nr:TetR/AcrR family transcriptional regulator [Acidimicrobiales bacterium]